MTKAAALADIAAITADIKAAKADGDAASVKDLKADLAFAKYDLAVATGADTAAAVTAVNAALPAADGIHSGDKAFAA